MLPKAKKEFGQNFLQDQSAIQKVIDAAEIQKGETVLEIGPGTGVITEALVKAGAKVTAVEIDEKLVELLKEKFDNQIELINDDILATNYLLPATFKLVSSLPYNITSDVLKKFLTQEPKPSKIIFVLQKEVVDRIVAKPSKMSLLSVMCQLYARCGKVANIKAGAFYPVPKVDSAIIKLDPCPKEQFKDYNPEQVIKLAKVGFSSKRKQLKNNLASFVNLNVAQIGEKLQEIGLDPRVRAENLTVENWVQLSQIFLL